MTKNFLPFFRNLELTMGYSDDELQEIIKIIDIRTFEVGDVILAEGQQTEGFHFLFSGVAEVWKKSSTAKDHFLIDTLKPGALFGEMSTMTGKPTSASVRAKSVCTVFLLQNPSLLPHELQVKLLLGSAHYVIDRLQHSTERQAQAMAAEAELKIAWTIQKSFLPGSFPELPKVDIYGTCDPAREIGGDYFDIFKIGKRRYGLVISDVSGKGVSAAIFMSGCRTLFRLLSRDGLPPDEVLKKFNERLVDLDPSATAFITIFYGILDVESGHFIYASAGHNMPYVRTERDGLLSVTQLPSIKSLVAGIMDDIEYSAEEMQLERGDLLVLYTDGITEAMNEKGDEFGEERLTDLIINDLSDSAEQFVQSTIDLCCAFQSGRPKHDDMTMLAIRMK